MVVSVFVGTVALGSLACKPVFAGTVTFSRKPDCCMSVFVGNVALGSLPDGYNPMLVGAAAFDS